MWYLPEEHRSRFKEPFGELFTDIVSALNFSGESPVYAVGDVVTYNLAKNGVVPEVAVIDGITMRKICTKTPVLPAELVEVENPAGTITQELINVLLSALKNPPVLVYVIGEEDLAVIPMVMYAPLGSAVFYGQPGEGVVVRVVDSESKKVAEELFSLFVKKDIPDSSG
ncbi:GTP-dependent dephospho-CoA kinase family protein [Methanoplanus limicola]|uniref:GTP-dependent dephospho-CoA kinase n=1 Tax=Methanoplanus limicola DSM 2279 TaxID=937775 RepID=H1Z151_9EURY|nr:GTP-dependent dephospho-CoA kinase family protein [Methanoplanus limicola]EHQ35318.1 UPF0218 protein [Methanoplanus limicola DSM 2279]